MVNKWEDIYKNEAESYNYYNIFKPHEDIPKVIEYFKLNGVKTVLDIGCGAGRNLLPLTKQGFNTFGYDLSPEGIKLAKKQLKKEELNADLKVLNFSDHLPYKDNFFDAAISIQVLQHGFESDIKKSIKEIFRILKENGIIFVTLCGKYDPNGDERFTLVKTAKKVAENTYIPTKGNEIGMPHFIYTEEFIKKHFIDFTIEELWVDSRNYYCFFAKKKQLWKF